METWEQTKERMFRIADERKEFVHLEDGYVYYWPDGDGALNPPILRAFADELDRRNTEWDAIVQKEVGGQPAIPVSAIKPREVWLIRIRGASQLIEVKVLRVFSLCVEVSDVDIYSLYSRRCYEVGVDCEFVERIHLAEG